jgi:hypothetical protein
MSASLKYTLLANILMVIFPVLFAYNVCSSVFLEGQADTLHPKNTDAVNDECTSSLLLNGSIAIVLGALWNFKKVLKIGSL